MDTRFEQFLLELSFYIKVKQHFTEEEAVILKDIFLIIEKVEPSAKGRLVRK